MASYLQVFGSGPLQLSPGQHGSSLAGVGVMHRCPTP